MSHAIVIERFAERDAQRGYEAVLQLIGQRVSSRLKIVVTAQEAVLQVDDCEKVTEINLDTETAVANKVSVGDQGVVWRAEDS